MIRSLEERVKDLKLAYRKGDMNFVAHEGMRLVEELTERRETCQATRQLTRRLDKLSDKDYAMFVQVQEDVGASNAEMLGVPPIGDNSRARSKRHVVWQMLEVRGISRRLVSYVYDVSVETIRYAVRVALVRAPLLSHRERVGLEELTHVCRPESDPGVENPKCGCRCRGADAVP